MVELMQKLNFPLLEVQPVTEYFRQFEKYDNISIGDTRLPSFSRNYGLRGRW